jgi:hypothetical protein
MEALNISETSVKFNQTTWRNIPEDSHLQEKRGFNESVYRLMYYAPPLRLIPEVRVRARVSPCRICGGKSDNGTGFSPSCSVSPANIIPPWLSTLIYHLGDEK